MKIKTDDIWFHILAAVGGINLLTALLLLSQGQTPTLQAIVGITTVIWIILRSKLYEWAKKEREND